MRRNGLFEIHDHPAFPPLLRDLFTDALQAIWIFGNSYRVVLPRLRSTLESAATNQVLDLCSGGGGPWFALAPHLQISSLRPIHVRFTDKYPNFEAFKNASLDPAFSYESRSVDAANVPDDLPGLRTIFSSFHHFSPTEARTILAAAFHDQKGIAVFEAAKPELKTMLVTCGIPFLAMYLALFAQPFRWSRLFFTFVIPVIPLALWFDGIVSCLRAYSPQELHHLIAGLSSNTYQWEIGEENGGLIPITFLIGYPIPPFNSSLPPDLSLQRLVSAPHLPRAHQLN